VTVHFPTSVDDAAALTGTFRAGGTDLQERLRTHGERVGETIVDLTRVAGLDAISVTAEGASIGALATVAEVAAHPELRARYPGLAATAGGLATPQVRQLATIGGNLLQSTRCWYARHPHLRCFKNGGDSCPAREGQHPYGVIFDRGPCVAPHPSSIGMALLAYDATVTVHGRRPMAAADVWGDGADPHRDHVLGPTDVVTSIELPAARPGERSAYFRAISRFEAEWPLVEAIACLQLDGRRIAHASVAVGGVATVPLRLPHVEAALVGHSSTDELLRRTAALASEGATPLPQTGYKVRLLEAVVLEVLERVTST
jgi:xanthine dehydrogenase YagS FAD-binding subunit